MIKLMDLLFYYSPLFSLTSVVLQVFYKYVDGQFLNLFNFLIPVKWEVWDLIFNNLGLK